MLKRIDHALSVNIMQYKKTELMKRWTTMNKTIVVLNTNGSLVLSIYQVTQQTNGSSWNIRHHKAVSTRMSRQKERFDQEMEYNE